jgi:anti-sigma regulatory factor (Ser/Thr protein kinase)
MPAAAAVPAPSLRVPVADASQVGEARRLAHGCCRLAALDEHTAGRVAIVVTEVATNVLRHGRGGELLLRVLSDGPARGVAVLALDHGPGIRDVARALQDGHSTAGTLGTGLGAIRRLSTVFDLFTSGAGTAVLSQVWTSSPPGPVYGAVCLAKRGEPEPGDVWVLQRLGEAWRAVVADGLGHGPDARAAAVALVNAVLASSDGVVNTLTAAHLAARSTRGGAAAVAEVAPAAGEVRFCGVGNVAGVLVDAGGSGRNMVSVNGTVGQGVVRPRVFTYAGGPGTLLVLYSDGLGSRWSLEAYPGLQARHPEIVAGILYRDHARGGRDDVTVLAARIEAS